MAFGDLFKIKEFKKEIETLKKERVKEIEQYINEISKLNEKLNTIEKQNKELQALISKYKQESNDYLVNCGESKEFNCNDFCTNEYKRQFESFIGNDAYTKEKILSKFNELYNKESFYFEGIAACIEFIRTKRKPKVSIEKQILNYILTDTGRKVLESYIKTLSDSEK